MTRIRPRVILALLAAGLLIGCSGVPRNPPAASPSSGASSAPAGGPPPACDAIVLVAPDGQPIDLTGEFAGTGFWSSQNETVFLNQVGGCVYGVVESGVGDVYGNRGVVNLTGQLTSDFTMETTVVFVLQEGPFHYGEHSTMVMAIEWDDDGRMRLRELRKSGTAGRCATFAFECPDPVTWYRVED